MAAAARGLLSAAELVVGEYRELVPAGPTKSTERLHISYVFDPFERLATAAAVLRRTLAHQGA